MKRTNNNFNIVRLTLSFLVFIYHWNVLTNQHISLKMFNLGGYAVDTFFIVSGFLIFWSFDRDNNKKHFYIKRFFRIYPIYIILIVIQTVFFMLYSDAELNKILKYFFANSLFLNFLAPSVGNIFSNLYVDAINGSLWTLKVEVTYYLFVPLIYIGYKKWGWYFLLVLYIVSVFYVFSMDYFHIEKLLKQFPGQLRFFLVGIFLYIFFDKFNKKNIYFYLFGSFSLLGLFSGNKYFEFILYPATIGIILLFIVYYIKKIKIDFDFSYSLYILHFPVIQILLYFNLNPTNPIYSFTSIVLILIVLSYLSEKYIEKNFIMIGRNLIHHLSRQNK